jgi:uncharacterized membrane protein YdjX (TVP38/TMEM64 family)
MAKQGHHSPERNGHADGGRLREPRAPDRAYRQAAAGSNRAKIVLGVAVVAALLGTYGLLSGTDALTAITDGPTLERYVIELGILGPLAIVALLAAAIVLNPIPSAPIALAAGAAYGHLWGTVYVVVGAEIGALIAFGIARLVGYEVLRRWLGSRLSLGSLASQNALMAAVFASRLLPFVSFDLVSYAAGLTPLTAWRFAVATLAGIIPASFLLAHFGGEMATADARRITVAVLALGAVTLVPIVAKLLFDRYRKQPADQNGEP